MLAVARIELAAGNPQLAIASLAKAREDAGHLARADPEDTEARDRLRLIDLVAVAAWLRRPVHARPADLAARTSFCANTRVDAGDEVTAWCRQLRVRLVPAEASRLDDAVARDPTLRIGRYSTHWGIDFTAAQNAIREPTPLAAQRVLR